MRSTRQNISGLAPEYSEGVIGKVALPPSQVLAYTDGKQDSHACHRIQNCLLVIPVAISASHSGIKTRRGELDRPV